MCCDCTALIWNIHLTCVVLCCHLPCVNSMAFIIEDRGWGWSEGPRALPCVAAPSDTVSLSGDYILTENKQRQRKHLQRGYRSQLSDNAANKIWPAKKKIIAEVSGWCIMLNEYWPLWLSIPRIPRPAVNNVIRPLEKTLVYPNSTTSACFHAPQHNMLLPLGLDSFLFETFLGSRRDTTSCICPK